MEITHVNSEILRFREIGSDDRWIDVKYFAYPGTGGNKDVLAALIANPWYDDDYASPSGALPEPSRGLHGPYSLASIGVASFSKVSARKSRETVRVWAQSLGPLPDGFARKYDDLMVQLLGAASAIFQLSVLDASARHRWNGQLGATGFHEFVVISPASKTVALIVASDD